MNTHVLIVDATTFKYHLEYMFFGTGAKDSNIDFNNSRVSKLHSTVENMLVAMIADGMRIRKGDNIIFYLQQKPAEGIKEGKFYGVFKATDDGVFLDNIGPSQYLYQQLSKSLTFRNTIIPDEVYPIGVTEWEALDEIKNIQSPHQMLWSLIYRKLKGNRGNTMITPYESERLIHLIRKKNANTVLSTSHQLTFDAQSQKIVDTLAPPKTYDGNKDIISIMPRLYSKHCAGKAYEAHLQAYIVQNLGQGTSLSLDAIFDNFSGYRINWIGNEVSCGVGMQRIDIAVELIKDGSNPHRVIMPIELKAVACKADDVQQLSRYVMWLQQYYLPNRPGDIQPVLLGEDSGSSSAVRLLKQKMIAFNATSEVNPIIYCEASINAVDIDFRIVNY